MRFHVIAAAVGALLVTACETPDIRSKDVAGTEVWFKKPEEVAATKFNIPDLIANIDSVKRQDRVGGASFHEFYFKNGRLITQIEHMQIGNFGTPTLNSVESAEDFDIFLRKISLSSPNRKPQKFKNPTTVGYYLAYGNCYAFRFGKRLRPNHYGLPDVVVTGDTCDLKVSIEQFIEKVSLRNP